MIASMITLTTPIEIAAQRSSDLTMPSSEIGTGSAHHAARQEHQEVDQQPSREEQAGGERRERKRAARNLPHYAFQILVRRTRRHGLPEPRSRQSSGSTLTIRWSWLLPTQNVTGVVVLSTNTVRMLVSDGIRYCTAPPLFGSSRTTRSVCIVDAQISPFLSKLARYGYVRGGRSYTVNFSAFVSNVVTRLPRYSVTTMRSCSSMFMRRA